MVERSIVCTADEVRRLLAGEVVEIRRTMKPQPELWQTNDGPRWAGKMPDGDFHDIENDALGRFVATCPLGAPGERRWVAEEWAPIERESDLMDGIRYRVDDIFIPIKNSRRAAERWVVAANNDHSGRWRSAAQMPRWASRLSIAISAVRCERSEDEQTWEWAVTAKPVETSDV